MGKILNFIFSFSLLNSDVEQPAKRAIRAMGTITSALFGEGGFELRGVVKPLVFFCGHLALLARYHLFGRPATRNSDILCTYTLVAFGLALSL